MQPQMSRQIWQNQASFFSFLAEIQNHEITATFWNGTSEE
jgi:hypothetical protein